LSWFSFQIKRHVYVSYKATLFCVLCAPCLLLRWHACLDFW
jgi:hypothetical protein